MKLYAVTLIGLITCLDASAQPVSKDEAARFFAQYVQLSNAFDMRFTEMYAPSARVIGLRHTDSGEKERQELTGAQWKQLVSFNLAKARKRNEQSTFSKIRYELQGEQVRIRALRYSLRKCHTDSSYSMLIGRHAREGLRIEEEIFETHLPSSCKSDASPVR